MLVWIDTVVVFILPVKRIGNVSTGSGVKQTHSAHSEVSKRLQSADLNQNHADIYRVLQRADRNTKGISYYNAKTLFN